MLVMMKHPLHGRLPVYSPSEVESNKAAGWIVDPDAPENQKPVPPPKATPIVAPEPAAPIVKVPRKGFFGSLDEDGI